MIFNTFHLKSAVREWIEINFFLSNQFQTCVHEKIFYAFIFFCTFARYRVNKPFFCIFCNDNINVRFVQSEVIRRSWSCDKHAKEITNSLLCTLPIVIEEIGLSSRDCSYNFSTVNYLWLISLENEKCSLIITFFLWRKKYQIHLRDNFSLGVKGCYF